MTMTCDQTLLNGLITNVVKLINTEVFSIGGEVLFSADNGRSFNYLPIRTGNRIYTVEAGPDNTLLFGGPAGIQKFPLPQ